MHKKKKDVVGGAEGWNAFSGGSFPNYFGEEGNTTAEESKPVSNNANLMDDNETVPTKVEVPKPETDLLGDVSPAPSKPAESIIDITMPTSSVEAPPPPKVDDFNTMQNMFSTMNVTSQPQPVNNNSMDFFAEEPKKEVVPPAPVVPANSAINFDLNMSGSNTSANNFATGFGLESSNVSAKAFATSAPGGKPLEVDFFNLPPKQEGPPAAFAKKPAEQPATTSQMENIFSGSSEKSVGKVADPLTDMSANDFMSSKPKEQEIVFPSSNIQPPPSASDFSTMQNLFQTSNPSTIQGMTQPQTSMMAPSSMGSAIGAPGTAPNESDFSTLQQMFQTNNYSNLNSSTSTAQVPQQKAPAADFFKNNTPATSNAPKPDVFATMGGGSNASSGFEFDMANFGTMQANGGKNPQGEVEFFGKPANSTGGGNNLI